MSDNSELAPTKAELSRRNGAKSKGPRTTEGKKRSRLNAVKHGVLSKVVVLDADESQVEFDEFLGELCKDLQPLGALEEILVDEIGTSYWRLRRVVLAECGEISKQLRFSSDRLMNEQRNQALIMEVENFAGEGVQSDKMRRSLALLSTSEGISTALGFLSNLITTISENGKLERTDVITLADIFPDDPAFIGHVRAHFYPEADPKTRIDMPPEVLTLIKLHLEDCSVPLRQILQEKKDKLRGELARKLISESVLLHYHHQSLFLPDSGIIDKIMRYENAVSRRLYRAMDQLERLQRRRRGESVPAPVKLTLDK